MEVYVRQFKNVVEGTNQLRVPHFQRTYSWEKKHWGRLWDDLQDLVDNAEAEPNPDKRQKHFLGSIVTMPAQSVPAGITKWLLIDGQQRVTTLLILLAKLRDTAQAAQSRLAERIQNVYLLNQYVVGDDCFKLLPTQGTGFTG